MNDDTAEKPDKMKILHEIHGLMSMHKVTQTELANKIPASIVSVHNWLKTTNITTYDNLYTMLDTVNLILKERSICDTQEV